MTKRRSLVVIGLACIFSAVLSARQAGEIRAMLAARGQAIGPYDVLIAGQAMARRLTPATHDGGEFGRVPGLAVDDWQV